MFTWFVGLFVIVLLASLGLAWLNLRHQEREGHRVPAELAGVVEPERLAKIADYTRDRARFGMLTRLLRSAGFALFLFGGWLGVYDAWVATFADTFVARGVCFFLGLVAAGAVLEIPFSLYQSFKIEARYGFNRMTLGLFFGDWLKSTLLSLLFVAGLSAAALALVQAAPGTWWLFVWLLFVVFSVVLTFVSPYLIEPLFFKTEPLKLEGLSEQVKALSERAGVHLSRVLQMDASRRSTHSNAYFTGIGRVKRVVLFDTLLTQMTHPEILAILAHELGHWKKHHVLFRTLASYALSFVALFALSRVVGAGFVPELVAASELSFAARAVVLATVASLLMFPLTPLFSAWSRHDEWEADRFAVDLSGLASELGSALAKLSRENLANLHPHPLYAKFYYSHPPVPERIRRLRSTQAVSGV
jgi:STE24 endopeptidase